jgi:phosphohistidine phosphatase
MLGRVVRLYLCRHAHAAPGDPDQLRELTDRGRAEADALAARLESATPAPEVVLASPLLRARQTAEPLARRLDVELLVDDAAAPGASAGSLLSALSALDAETVVVVGHQPDCSEIARALSGSDPGFPPAGMVALDVEA